jgi:hypothetical protein
MRALNPFSSQENLIRNIKHFGRIARESRQVMKRMVELLPNRLRSLKNSQHTDGITRSKAERLALTHDSYKQEVQRYLHIYKNGVEARIQYETHMMLFEARRSLRRLKL